MCFFPLKILTIHMIISKSDQHIYYYVKMIVIEIVIVIVCYRAILLAPMIRHLQFKGQAMSKKICLSMKHIVPHLTGYLDDKVEPISPSKDKTTAALPFYFAKQYTQ